jgi:hypothetical protein
MLISIEDALTIKFGSSRQVHFAVCRRSEPECGPRTGVSFSSGELQWAVAPTKWSNILPHSVQVTDARDRRGKTS